MAHIELSVTLVIEEPDGSFVERTPYSLFRGLVSFYEKERIVCGNLATMTRATAKLEDLDDWKQWASKAKKAD